MNSLVTFLVCLFAFALFVVVLGARLSRRHRDDELKERIAHDVVMIDVHYPI